MSSSASHQGPLAQSAEQPVDNWQTVERHHAEGPLSDGARVCRQTTRHFPRVRQRLVTHMASRLRHTRAPLSRWMAQTDERRVEAPQRLARYQLQRPFHCGIDVTVTCESSKLITSGQHRHAAPFIQSLPKCKSHARHFAKVEDRGASPRGSTISCGRRPVAGHGYARAETSVRIRLTAPTSNSSVADPARHRSRNSYHVSASAQSRGAEQKMHSGRSRNLTGGSISHSLHSVTAAFFVVNEAVPGQNRLREPFHSCTRQRAEPAACKTALPSASLGRTSNFKAESQVQRAESLNSLCPTPSALRHFGYERASELTWFGTKTRPWQHRGIRPFSRPRSSADRVADYESAGRRCKSCRGHFFETPLAQSAEHRASNAEVAGASPARSAISR